MFTVTVLVLPSLSKPLAAALARAAFRDALPGSGLSTLTDSTLKNNWEAPARAAASAPAWTRRLSSGRMPPSRVMATTLSRTTRQTATRITTWPRRRWLWDRYSMGFTYLGAPRGGAKGSGVLG